MDLDRAIDETVRACAGLNGPAMDDDIARLREAVGALPTELERVYRRFDGSAGLPPIGDEMSPVRLMPAAEAAAVREGLEGVGPGAEAIGPVAWTWTDDESNYAGVYTAGPLAGMVTKLRHDEPSPTPSHRGVAGFLAAVLRSVLEPGPDGPAIDLAEVPDDLPAMADDRALIDADRRLAAALEALAPTPADAEADENAADRRRLLLKCAMTFTPVADTARVLAYLGEDDMWTPEAAVALLDLRGYSGGVAELERLARDGRPNGDRAAMRRLVRMGTPEARAALARLRAVVTGQKLATLEMWEGGAERLRPAPWR